MGNSLRNSDAIQEVSSGAAEAIELQSSLVLGGFYICVFLIAVVYSIWMDKD